MDMFWIGLASGALTTLAGLPQLYKIYKNKSGRGLSYLFMLMLLVGVVGWELYGLSRGDVVLIIWNLVALVLDTAIIALKAYYDEFYPDRDNSKMFAKYLGPDRVE